jgi:FKBP-type peptidyl-prolyl cis-trans isomerase
MDMVQVLYTSSLPDGTEIASMQDSSNSLEFVVGNNEVLKGWDEALLLMKTGEEMQFLLPPQLAYGEKSFGKIKSNSTIILTVKLLDHYSAFYSKPNEEFLTTESGLKYKIYKPNIAKEPLVPGNYVLFSYTGYTIDLNTGKRTIFESSNRTKATTYVQYGVGNFVKGLEEGFSLMGVGDFATFIMPPNLAYGNKDNKLVPANSVVGFDIYVQEQSNPFFSNDLPMTKDDIIGYSYAFISYIGKLRLKINITLIFIIVGHLKNIIINV